MRRLAAEREHRIPVQTSQLAKIMVEQMEHLNETEERTTNFEHLYVIVASNRIQREEWL